MEQNRFILDSYAILAFLQGTPGVEQVKKLLLEASGEQCQLFVSIVNVGEVLYLIERENDLFAAQEALARIDELPIKVIDINRAHTIVASHLKAGGRISFADCYAAALGIMNQATVVTGDPEFKRLESASIISVLWLIDD